ncbi:hypothetical protein HFP89_07805 [Wenzhouxiangella sp. XN79A]|uniref:exosortase H-associated membrane protein n=1 Tax=Wenzhouxiangella sp. XN79A TaxID=2724193 RepID=UPI00144A7682|nr:exosortase H-associated membrane protein [Wenzhouxiangella sp. XN79A]NKI35068.1 hypothetical protein [Wenzhouxiangella sp. XN79A]
MSEPQRPESNEPSNDDEISISDNPIKEMFLLAILYLPLGFFLWFYLASALMWFPARLTDWALTGLFPEIFRDVVQFGYRLEIQLQFVRPEGRIALADREIMIYAWGMALLFGLIMATPMSIKRRLAQLGIGYVVVSFVTAWGAFWDAMKEVAFKVQPEGVAAIAQTAVSPTMIALFYQLGYLMLPAVVPLATWILMNRPFLEDVVFTRKR